MRKLAFAAILVATTSTFAVSPAVAQTAARTSAPAGAAPADPAPPTALTADTPQVTASGARFIAPRGWSVTDAGGVIKVTPPEPDSHFVVVDVPQAADAAAAVA